MAIRSALVLAALVALDVVSPGSCGNRPPRPRPGLSDLPTPSDAAVSEAAAPSESPRTDASAKRIITEKRQLEGAVDAEVIVIGVLTRTKIPTVCGADVDGDYRISDREVEARGVLRREVVSSADATSANRGPGTYYSVVDPATGQLAKATLVR